MVSSTIAGAEYGLTLVWALVVGVIIKFAITEGAARWQLATGITLIEGWRDALPRVGGRRLLPLLHRLELLRLERARHGQRAGAGGDHAVACRCRCGAWCTRVAALAMVWFGRYERFLVDHQVVRRPEVRRHHRLGAADRAVVRRRLVATPARASRSRVAYTLSLIGGVGGTVTLLSYGYWMREAGWRGAERLPSARTDLTLSFTLVFIFCFSMIFLSTQIDWQGADPRRGPAAVPAAGRSHRRRRSARSAARCSCSASGARRSRRCSASTTACRSCSTTCCTCGSAGAAAGSRARPIAPGPSTWRWPRSRRCVIRRPVWLVFAYTVVGLDVLPVRDLDAALAQQLAAATIRQARNGLLVNGVLGAALLLYVYLAVSGTRRLTV